MDETSMHMTSFQFFYSVWINISLNFFFFFLAICSPN